MTMSLDGFVNDANGGASALYPDLAGSRGRSIHERGNRADRRRPDGQKSVRDGDPDSYVGNYEFQVPIVLTHQPADAPKQDERVTFTFLADLASAVEQAKAAAGDRVVQVVGGPPA